MLGLRDSEQIDKGVVEGLEGGVKVVVDWGKAVPKGFQLLN